MLPIIDRPLIQYAVDEAIEAGCDTLVFVTNRYKHAVADYFDKAYELEQKLERAGKVEQLELVRNVLPPGVRAVFVTQAERALGLGHAVLCAKPIVGDEPFAVLLPDDLIWNRGTGALAQMADAAQASGASVIAVEDVPAESTGSYGIVATDTFDGRQGRIRRIVREAAACRGPEQPGGGGALRAQPAHLRPARSGAAGGGWGDPVDRRDRRLAGRRAGERLSLPGHALRLWHPHRPDRGHHPLCAGPREAQPDPARDMMQRALGELGVRERD